MLLIRELIMQAPRKLVFTLDEDSVYLFSLRASDMELMRGRAAKGGDKCFGVVLESLIFFL